MLRVHQMISGTYEGERLVMKALLITLLVAVTILLGAAPYAGAQSVPTCKGKPATIIGTAGNDNLRGTNGDDVIVGLGGDDDIFAFGGNDTICGGEGVDELFGQDGNDTVIGEGGND